MAQQQLDIFNMMKKIHDEDIEELKECLRIKNETIEELLEFKRKALAYVEYLENTVLNHVETINIFEAEHPKIAIDKS